MEWVHTEPFDGNRVLPVKFSAEYKSCHQIFFKPHKVPDSSDEKPVGRTLFLSNIPPWASADSLRRLFSANGPVENVFLQKIPSSGAPPVEISKYFIDHPELRVGHGFKYAYIVFERPSSVQNAMKKMKVSEPRCLSTKENPIEIGLNKWRQEYRDGLITDLDGLKREIEEFVADHDRKKAEEISKAEEEAEPDEDGWTVVSRHTAKKPVGKISNKAQAKVKAREQRKRKRKELENFYKFQMKESKLQKMEELKQKFEVDKKRQAQMKQDRKFKPV